MDNACVKSIKSISPFIFIINYSESFFLKKEPHKWKIGMQEANSDALQTCSEKQTNKQIIL